MAVRKLTAVSWKDVQFDAGFLGDRIRTNREATLPIEYTQCKKTGRMDAWKWEAGKPKQPHIFWDSDVAKWIEAVAYSLATHPDPKLERQVDRVIDSIAEAQQADGYLNSYFTRVEPGVRWRNLRSEHELYCAGHLMEAAVAYHEATGKQKLLDIMCRYADCIDGTFGLAKGKLRGYPGHEEIELALIKLYRATGEKRYLDLASYFVEQRGQSPHYYDGEAKRRNAKPQGNPWFDYAYCQAHTPVREQTEVVGHAVRAMYLYSGMADLAAETGDATLVAACRRLWQSVTRRRMYVTGGIGPTARNEGFTVDYDLPNETAYAETCAAIGLVFWAHRMLHCDVDGQYADVMERALYNGVLSGVSLDGEKFFYDNPLAAYPPAGTGKHVRQEWFGCACCPPNVARLLASLGQYVYSTDAKGAWVHLYAAGRADLTVGDRRVAIAQKTAYPWKQSVKLTVTPDQAATFTLSLRIPGWCRGAKLAINGKVAKCGSRKGYMSIRREWSPGDRVTLTLPMTIERMEANPEVRQDAGRTALQRGPVVYCLEEADNGKGLFDLYLPAWMKMRHKFEPEVLGGVTVITGKGRRRKRDTWGDVLYRPAGSKGELATITAIPYACWANRAPGEMAVWLRSE